MSRWDVSKYLLAIKSLFWPWAPVFFYGLVMAGLVLLKYEYFLYADFDLAVHAQALWNIAQGDWRSSILGTGYLGNHVHLINLLVLPVGLFFPVAQSLLVLQTVAFALSAVPVFLTARYFLDTVSARWILLVYLLYPGLWYSSLYEFHPTCFAALFLAWMLYFYVRQDFNRTMFWAGMGMLCQENIALVVMFTGVLSLVDRRGWKWVLIPFLSGWVYFFVCVFWVLPSLAGDRLNLFSIYARWGSSPNEVFWSFLTRPWEVVLMLLGKERLVYLFSLFWPLCFIPVLGSRALIPILPLFLQHMLSGRSAELSLEFHYTAEMLPFLVLALVTGVPRLERFIRPKVSLVIVALLTVTSWILGPRMELLRILNAVRYPQKKQLMSEAVARVDNSKPLLASFAFLSHTAERRELYSFHHVLEGTYTFSLRPFDLPDGTEQALIDFDDNFLSWEPAFDEPNSRLLFYMQDWSSHEVWDSVVLFRKGQKSEISPLWEKLSQESAAGPYTRMQILPGVSLQVRKSQRFDKERQHLELFWVVTGNPGRDMNRFFWIGDWQKGAARMVSVPLLYRAYPSRFWKSGDVFRENVYLRLEGAERSCPDLPFYIMLTDKNTGELLKILQIYLK